ncbi:nucleic acid-binding protein [Xylona heveae TC161]|uniref:Nucleic acid-binding protein n=1 Tax=Xylona heveae (strain CBS 132557 / TC161) TaxID=1328760 RepID=A0A164ZPJ6_XYLHT|nr:nucleic acid-binding protein [Xylona heveae TC161]KZF19346.1 nucleic acid-binding protein [Xylona heveae TC161]
MPRPKRNVLAAAQESFEPPVELTEGQHIARVVKINGNNLYLAELPSKKQLLVELPSRFRSTVWIRRGGYVLVDTNAFADRENKLDGEIAAVIRNDKEWRKMNYWPQEFAKKSSYLEESDEDESTVGKLPPSDDEDDA